MKTCQECSTRNTCKKPCKEIEKTLRDSGIYSQEWIRPQVSKEKRRKDGYGKWREIPLSHRIYDQFRPNNS